MNIYLSEKLKVISFFAMLLVVFLHSYNPEAVSLSLENSGYNAFIQDAVSQGFCRIAVPFFFAISGFLFFLKMDGSKATMLLKIKKRIRTLLIPYLSWSLWGLLLFFVLQNLPLAKNYFTHNLISEYSISKLVTTVLFNPLPYQLWFIRDLMIMVLLSPLVYWMIKYFKTVFVWVFMITWYMSFDFMLFSNISIFYFILGSYLCMEKPDLLAIDLSKFATTSAFVWIALVIIKTYLALSGFQNEVILAVLFKTGIVAGIFTTWSLYDYLFRNKNLPDYRFYSLLSFSFFLYAFHEPVLTIFKKLIAPLLEKNEMAFMVIYFTAPIVTICISIAAGYLVRQTLPKLYGFVTGGR